MNRHRGTGPRTWQWVLLAAIAAGLVLNCAVIVADRWSR